VHGFGLNVDYVASQQISGHERTD